MSDTAASSTSWPVFTTIQRRLLGVLVEKSKTTPEAYPLSLNALVVGSNQKSNRDPVMTVTEDDVAEALDTLLPLGLVTRITGSRVDRWRHNCYDVWAVDKVELAILAELLLRGPQTEGELRQHAHRMDAIADLDFLRQKLKPLQERRLIHWLGEEGRRGAMITHGFCSPGELEKLRQGVKTMEPAPATAPAPPAPSGSSGELTALRAEVAQLTTTVGQLQAQFDSLRTEFAVLKQSLGG